MASAVRFVVLVRGKSRFRCPLPPASSADGLRSLRENFFKLFPPLPENIDDYRLYSLRDGACITEVGFIEERELLTFSDSPIHPLVGALFLRALASTLFFFPFLLLRLKEDASPIKNPRKQKKKHKANRHHKEKTQKTKKGSELLEIEEDPDERRRSREDTPSDEESGSSSRSSGEEDDEDDGRKKRRRPPRKAFTSRSTAHRLELHQEGRDRRNRMSVRDGKLLTAAHLLVEEYNEANGQRNGPKFEDIWPRISQTVFLVRQLSKYLKSAADPTREPTLEELLAMPDGEAVVAALAGNRNSVLKPLLERWIAHRNKERARKRKGPPTEEADLQQEQQLDASWGPRLSIQIDNNSGDGDGDGAEVEEEQPEPEAPSPPLQPPEPAAPPPPPEGGEAPPPPPNPISKRRRRLPVSIEPFLGPASPSPFSSPELTINIVPPRKTPTTPRKSTRLKRSAAALPRRRNSDRLRALEELHQKYSSEIKKTPGGSEDPEDFFRVMSKTPVTTPSALKTPSSTPRGGNVRWKDLPSNSSSGTSPSSPSEPSPTPVHSPGWEPRTRKEMQIFLDACKDLSPES